VNLLRRKRATREPLQFSQLSDREKRVLELRFPGRSSAEIIDELEKRLWKGGGGLKV
jgi:DNA-directed RNA polymerase specialized sigma subunit